MNMIITSLFSSFDPTSSIKIIPNWLRTITLLLFVIKNKIKLSSKKNILIKNIIIFLHKESKILAASSYKPGRSLIILRTIILILINNILGLVPYIFTTTRHILFTLSLALPIWITFIIYGWSKSNLIIFAHLVPSGTPPILISFIVIIETVSNIIRPITLSVRLAANIIAGHLLITLLGNQGINIKSNIIPILIITQFLLILLETAVAFIQTYVFTTLSTLYSREVNYVKFQTSISYSK